MHQRLIKYFLCIVCFFIIANNSYSQWQRIQSGTTSRLNSIFFINNTTGWISGFEVVLKTTDSGNNWTSEYISGNLKSVYFNNTNTGWMCGENGKLLKTNDAGANWFSVNSNVNVSLNQISFADENTGYIAGNNGTILKTSNAGINWNNVLMTNSSEIFHSLKILSKDVIIVSGTNSKILKSTNAGATWDSTDFKMPNPLVTLDFADENTGWVSGCCGMFMRTTNAGINWTEEKYLTLGFTINSMKFVDSNYGWQAGDAGYILRTTNGGINWDSLNSTTPTGLYSVFFINRDSGFVVGYNGLILRTVNGGGQGVPIGIGKVSANVPQKFFLHQNNPNPFNPLTRIDYELDNTYNVSLKIYDVLGNEVSSLVDEKQFQGIYSIDFDGNNLSSGIYFYRLWLSTPSGDTEKFSLVKKMMLLK
ncbi:MAG: YCF48-related protein [Ignavibacteria bacterium]